MGYERGLNGFLVLVVPCFFLFGKTFFFCFPREFFVLQKCLCCFPHYKFFFFFGGGGWGGGFLGLGLYLASF